MTVSALLKELSLREKEIPGAIHTLYIGGGTPSLLNPGEWKRLIKGVRDILGERLDLREFTIEVNPDDVSEEMIVAWRESGVDRFSMGIQSLSDDILSLLGRRHTASEAIRAAELLAGAGRLSLDLIYGLPGQTPEMWKNDVEGIISLNPGHISAYSLTYEESTALARMKRLGMVAEAEEGVALKMYSELCRLTRLSGYEHYEISSFARPGEQSRHNSSYWTSSPYLGIGPSASSYDGRNRRRTNPADLRNWLSFYENDGWDGNFFVEEVLNKEEIFEEMVMTRLRTSQGISLREVKEGLGDEFVERLRKRSRRHLESGNLRLSENKYGIRHLILTDKGEFIADAVIVDLIM